MRYHVFIEGTHDPSPGARERLAAALAQRYGLPAEVVTQRLTQGRFCAWASLDLPTARRLGGELESIGARYTIAEDGAGATSTGASAAPPAGRSTVHGHALPPPRAGAAPSARSGAVSDSGLAAAFAGDRLRTDEQLDLGALQRGDTQESSWRLSNLDGTDEERTMESPAMVAAVVAAERRVAGTTGAPPPRGRDSKPPRSFAPPLDPFAPPDAGRESQLQLQDKPAAVGTLSQPVATMAAAPSGGTLGGTRSAAPVIGASTLHRDPFVTRMRETMAESSRARFAAGLVVAFLIGLIPAQLYAMWRGDAAEQEVRSALDVEYRAASTPELWSTLGSARDDAGALMSSRQRRVAVSAVLIWLATGAGVAFVWFRVIDWQGALPRIAQAPDPRAADSRRRATR